VRAEAVRGDAISFEKTVTDTENVVFDKLQPDTEYKVSVEGISKLPPKSEVSFSHRRTKRRYGSYRPQRPQTPATDSRRTSSSNRNQAASTPQSTYGYQIVDKSKFDPDATVIKECKRIDQTDLVILIDGSWSVTPTNFERVKIFLSALLKHFSIGHDASMIGIAQYSDNPRLEFGLNEHYDFPSLNAAVNRMKYKAGWQFRIGKIGIFGSASANFPIGRNSVGRAVKFCR